jgi:hypothetical protein
MRLGCTNTSTSQGAAPLVATEAAMHATAPASVTPYGHAATPLTVQATYSAAHPRVPIRSGSDALCAARVSKRRLRACDTELPARVRRFRTGQTSCRTPYAAAGNPTALSASECTGRNLQPWAASTCQKCIRVLSELAQKRVNDAAAGRACTHATPAGSAHRRQLHSRSSMHDEACDATAPDPRAGATSEACSCPPRDRSQQATSGTRRDTAPKTIMHAGASLSGAGGLKSS